MPRKSPSRSTRPEIVTLDPDNAGKMKHLGGAASDNWNAHLIGKLVAAVPGGMNPDDRPFLLQAVVGGQLGLKPEDPVEAMLSAQMIAANAAALDLYRRAWIQEQSFEVRTRFLALADKAARTLAVLTEALARHRGRGQQQITVKHVTVNAEQAVVADQVVANGRPTVEGGGGDEQRTDDQPHAKPALAHAPVAPLPCTVEADWAALPGSGR